MAKKKTIPSAKPVLANQSEFCAGGFSPSTVVHPSLKTYFSYCLYKSAARMRAVLNQALEVEGLDGLRLGILKIIEAGGPVSQVDLGGSMGIDKATMVKLLDGLEKSSFVIRKGADGDRRVKLIHLTAAGGAKLKVASKVRDKAEKEFLGHLSENERQALKTILPKLLK